MAVADCRVLAVPEHRDARGALVAYEHPRQVPFVPVRTFVLYDVPAGARRGGHAHKACHELLIAFGGTVRVTLSDPFGERTVTLSRPTEALHLAPLTWLDIEGMDPDAICVVLCSHPYDEDDYLRDRTGFDALFAEAV